MSNPYRDMCAELIGELHEYKVAHPNHGTDIIDRARALLDQPEPEGPTTAELMNLSAACNSPSVFARAVLAHWGRTTPQPPVDGEVAELVEWVGKDRQWLDLRRDVKDRILRIADLLQHPQPVAVSERPWEREGWCDAEGQCWWWRSDGVEEFWELTCVPDPISHNSKCAENVSYGPCLPAHALPTPRSPREPLPSFP
jgi:hypothetical protein